MKATAGSQELGTWRDTGGGGSMDGWETRIQGTNDAKDTDYWLS